MVGSLKLSASSSSASSTNDLVCDYDKNVTQLYALLASLNWDKVRLRCQTHPKEVQTWIVRYDASNGGNIRWKLLPLHAAVIFEAPLPIVECLLNEYPAAAMRKDDKGLLPLHLAFRHNKHRDSDAVIVALLQQYPRGVAVRDRMERLPLDLANVETSKFSARTLKIYSETFAKFQESKQLEATKAMNKVRMENLQSMHEERMNTVQKEHDQLIRHLKQQAQQEQHDLRIQHEQEVDDLRDLLTREVESGKNSTQLEMRLKTLERSLAETNQETRKLEDIIQQQKTYEEQLKQEIRNLLGDQKKIHSLCLDQQRQLEAMQIFREGILTSLILREDGKGVEKSKEMKELSQHVEFRTNQILATATST